MTLKHNWLDDGPLLILMPRKLMPEWKGGDSSVYDRACKAAQDWLVPINVGDGTALLLGGDPGMAMFVDAENSGPILVRWIYANNEEELIDIALRRENTKRAEPDILLHNAETRWTLFNSACNPSVDKPTIREVELPLGPLVIETAFLKSDYTAAIVHRFRPDVVRDSAL